MTLAEKAYDALRHDIIRGELPPGRPLRLSDLSERYEMGFSPLREALNRLQAERLVTAESLRGFRVAPLSLDELLDGMQDWERMLLLMRSEGRAYAEIAQYIDKPEDQLKVYYQRLKEKIAKKLNEGRNGTY